MNQKHRSESLAKPVIRMEAIPGARQTRVLLIYGGNGFKLYIIATQLYMVWDALQEMSLAGISQTGIGGMAVAP